MKYIHERYFLNANESVEVQCSQRCAVYLFTPEEFKLFRADLRGPHQNYNPIFQESPQVLTVFYSDFWELVIIFENDDKNITYSVTTLVGS
jgi:hypothetical protein